VIAAGRRPSRRKVYQAAHLLYELEHEFGTGQVNRFSLREFHDRFASRKTHHAAKKQWNRLRKTWSQIKAPVHDETEGREAYVYLGPDAKQFALETLNGLSQYAYRKGEENVIANSRFREVDIADIEPPHDWEPDEARIEAMKESISTCPIGLINPIYLVGEVPPFQLGLGRVRLAACKALGKKRILARLVNEWDPIIALDEEHVRRYYTQADFEHWRHLRDEAIPRAHRPANE